MTGGIRERISSIIPLVTGEQILQARHDVQAVYLAGKVLDYIHALIMATRSHELIVTGLSTRAAINLAQASKAAAFLAGRDYVAPDDVKSCAVAVLAHRLVMRGNATGSERGGVLRTIIAGIPLPLV